MELFLTPVSFILIIIIGYTMRTRGIVTAQDAQLIARLLINVTLPAAVVVAFSSLKFDPALYSLVAIGFLCSFLPMLLTWLATAGQKNATRAFLMINVTGFNIGCFALPFVQATFGMQASVLAILFDTGNAIMMTGGAWAMTSTLLKTNPDEQISVRQTLLKFTRSVPFMTYMLMLLVSVAGLRAPQAVVTLLTPIAHANPFMAMLMIGMLLNLRIERARLKLAIGVVALRLLFGCAFSAAIFFLLPMDLLVRQVLAVVVFAPASSLAPLYTLQCRADGELASFTNNLTIVTSLVVMTGIVMLY